MKEMREEGALGRETRSAKALSGESGSPNLRNSRGSLAAGEGG